MPTLDPRLAGLTNSGSFSPARIRRRTARGARAASGSKTTSWGTTGRPRGPEHLLHDRLVHAHGRSEDSGSDEGDVGQLEKALDRAVFAAGAVKDRPVDVGPERRPCPPLVSQGRKEWNGPRASRAGVRWGEGTSAPAAVFIDEDADGAGNGPGRDCRRRPGRR